MINEGASEHSIGVDGKGALLDHPGAYNPNHNGAGCSPCGNSQRQTLQCRRSQEFHGIARQSSEAVGKSRTQEHRSLRPQHRLAQQDTLLQCTPLQ
jgi:hypothetical protein